MTTDNEQEYEIRPAGKGRVRIRPVEPTPPLRISFGGLAYIFPVWSGIVVAGLIYEGEQKLFGAYQIPSPVDLIELVSAIIASYIITSRLLGNIRDVAGLQWASLLLIIVGCVIGTFLGIGPYR